MVSFNIILRNDTVVLYSGLVQKVSGVSLLKKSEIKETKDIYEENRRLRKKLEEAEKEVRFLKKAAAFFAKEID